MSAAVDLWRRLPDATFIAPCTLAEADELWQGYQRDWAARLRALQVIADSAGHCVHEDAPALVASMIDSVVRAVREGADVQFDPQILGQAGGRLVVSQSRAGRHERADQFLTAGLVDELHLVVAPFFVGDASAPRFVGDGRFPWNADHRMTLAEARPIGDVVLLRYLTEGRSAA